MTLELQHCVALETKDQSDSLKFVRAPLVGSYSNAEFTIMERGEFTLNYLQLNEQPAGIIILIVWYGL